jgi:hypothetical protein
MSLTPAAYRNCAFSINDSSCIQPKKKLSGDILGEKKGGRDLRAKSTCPSIVVPEIWGVIAWFGM